MTSLKLVVCGDGGVGKSSITTAFLRRDFSEEYDPAIEDAYSTSISVPGHGDVDLEIIDTAGQEEYRSLFSEDHVRTGDAFLCVYSIDSKQSLAAIDRYLKTIRRVKRPDIDDDEPLSPANATFPFIVIGNKCDLGPTNRQVTAAEGLAFARNVGGLFSESSAKQRVNIQSAFEALVREVKQKQSDPNTPASGSGSARGGTGGISIVDDNDDYEKGTRPPRKRNPALALDRRRSVSHGGLGRDPSHLSGHKTGCRCVIS